jgi:hypothetical protein
MEWLTGARVALTPRPARRREAALEVALLGHCPGRVRLERLLALDDALDGLRSAGFGEAADLLRAARPSNGGGLSEALRELYHLPLPLRSSAEFHDIFPDAAAAACSYVSLLAGPEAWLAQAVDDFFANGGDKLWLVRIPESEGQAGFLPTNAVLHDVNTLRGLASVLVIPSVAVVAMPDLERLQVPALLRKNSALAVLAPEPQFLPCAGQDELESQAGAIGSVAAPAATTAPGPLPLEQLLRDILPFIARYRPDVQLLLTLPLSYSAETGRPVADPTALRLVDEIRKNGSRALLRHVQLLFPYIGGPRFALRSSVGLVAGKQAAVARAKGPWHSIGALPLVSEGRPYPRLSMAQTLVLRERPGVGVVQLRSGFGATAQMSLDDERLAVPALPLSDYENGDDISRFDGFRSAEIMRFLGFLRRQLQALGDHLVFSVDVDDPRPRLLLQDFFLRLYHHGALRGRVPEEAFQIQQSTPQAAAIQFDIQVAPAFPIDRIFLTFINLDGEWQTEIGDA